MERVEEIKIDVRDWYDEVARAEENALNLDDFYILAIEKGDSSAQIFRKYVIQRELGLADDDVLPDNKTLFQAGGTNAVAVAFTRRKKEIEVNGKKYHARELVAGVTDDDSQARSETHPLGATFESTAETKEEPVINWQVLGSPGACDEAWKFIKRRIPGYIIGRFLVLRESGGDVREAADWLIDMIDKAADELA